MSDKDSAGEKTEAPSQKKLRDSRKNGQVASSKELNSFVVMTYFIFVLAIFHKDLMSLLSIDYVSSFTSRVFENNTQLFNYTLSVLGTNIKIIVALVVVAAIFGTFMSVVQIGGIVINEKAFKFDINRLNPVENFKQIFSKKGFIKFFTSFVEIVVICIVGLFYVSSNLPTVLNVNYVDFLSALWALTIIIFKLLVIMLGMHFAFSMLYLFLEKRHLFNQLKMTKKELKDEEKELNGNPEVKQKRRELYQEFMQEDGLYNILSQSTLVLANPTHIAVVIMYSPLKYKLPIVMLKLKDDQAQLVFKIAKKINLPILRDIPLARAIYAVGEVGKFVPSSCISDVAELIGKNIDLFPKVAAELIQLQDNKVAELKV